MIKALVYPQDNRYQCTVDAILKGNQCVVNLGSNSVTAVHNLELRVGDQVLASKLKNQWAVISKIRQGGKTKEVKV